MVELTESVANPGSALGEAIGVLMENALNRTLKPIAETKDCIFIDAGPLNIRTNLETKLLLKDSNDIEYNIDAVIANKKFQPLVLIESKYIRYKKHNRDKGSWVCTAHQSLRNRFSSIRSSVAVIAGNWSNTSKAMMKSFDITLFEIPFSSLAEILSEYGIDFYWKEKERDKAFKAWNTFISLSDKQRQEIGDKLISIIEKDIDTTISKVLDNTIPRSIKDVEIQVTSNLGEMKIYNFKGIIEALKFLKDLENNQDKILDTDNSPTLFENIGN